MNIVLGRVKGLPEKAPVLLSTPSCGSAVACATRLIEHVEQQTL